MRYEAGQTCKKAVLGPVSAASENSVHSRSRVQKAKGIDHASCRHRTLTPACPAASRMRATLSKIACARLTNGEQQALATRLARRRVDFRSQTQHWPVTYRGQSQHHYWC